MKQLTMFQKVKTPDGIGTLVGFSCNFDAVKVNRDNATVTVWYGIDKPQNGWCSREYVLKDVNPVDPAV